MKNNINENNVYVNRIMYKDPDIQQTAKKYKQNLVVLPDDKYNKMLKNQEADSTADSSSNVTTSTVTSGGMYENDKVDAVIEPQDQETIKYLSNVKDHKTGEVSKPFTIDGKNYQMVRGMKPNREIVLGVLCLGEMNESGGHKIHSVDHFEKTIAIPMKECGMGQMNPMEEKEEPRQDKEKFVDHLNLNDMNGFKHFFVNTKTGDVTAKFKTTDEMLKSGIKLGPDERYTNPKGLKQVRYGNYFKTTVNEADEVGVEGTNVDKLKADVQKLTKLISAKFSTAISKIDKPIEQVEFLSAMAEIIGVPFNKLTMLINSFKDVASQQKGVAPVKEPLATAAAVAEHKVINKDTLLESMGVKQTITKIKDNNKNGK